MSLLHKKLPEGVRFVEPQVGNVFSNLYPLVLLTCITMLYNVPGKKRLAVPINSLQLYKILCFALEIINNMYM